MAVDFNGGGVLPTITVEDADRATQEEQEKERSGSGTPDTLSASTVPGEFPSGAAPAIPEWYKVGWRAVANIDAPPPEEGEEKDKHVLHLYLSEQYYGEWYHNAGLMFFVSLYPKFFPFIICLPPYRCTGCIRFPFLDAFQFRLGMADYLAIYLQHLLCHFNGSCPPPCT